METTRTLQARAAADDAGAIFRLGHRLAYSRPRKRPEPWAEILALWQRALALGQERANLHLARLYVDGHGVPRSLGHAVSHCAYAAMDGFQDAQPESEPESDSEPASRIRIRIRISAPQVGPPARRKVRSSVA